MRKQEGTLKEDEAASIDEKVATLLREEKTQSESDVKINDNFNLPYGLGFDSIIKQKTDAVN